LVILTCDDWRSIIDPLTSRRGRTPQAAGGSCDLLPVGFPWFGAPVIKLNGSNSAAHDVDPRKRCGRFLAQTCAEPNPAEMERQVCDHSRRIESRVAKDNGKSRMVNERLLVVPSARGGLCAISVDSHGLRG
jgi:hypothetical protein